ncbi:ABC transporter permease [Bifidobacterium bombi]|uniref:ABC-2 family transporter protein n=1 Tax=Bifidobacterium bombi DSM 19703 TaxID=1341695 RepID=A0A080N6D0_9BIFI|nr:ABC transporter permease [Bifidobacterium bombi]KFF31504.1 ABC-2 family transporter protein [Bifidobacterium bombi DSM 19703]
MSMVATKVTGPVRPLRHSAPKGARCGGFGVLLALEVRKLKGSSFWWMASAMVAMVCAWSGLAFMKRAGSGNAALHTLALAQGEVYQTVGLLAPILAALLTSRLSVMETGERMDLKWRSLGQGAGDRFFAKLAVAGVAVSLAFMVPLVWVPFAGLSDGFALGGDFAALVFAPVLIALASSMAVSAIQLALSLTVGKQAVGLGVGVIAGLIGTGLGPMNAARLGWLFPAGISSAASPFLTIAGTDGHARMTLVSNPWSCVAGSLLACIIWIVISAVIITIKESRQ